MVAIRSEAVVETLFGALVLIAAAVFLAYSLATGGIGASPAGYKLTAHFGQVGSLVVGADVRVSGVKVGKVTAIRLDPKRYLAETELSFQPSLRLPDDSTAKVTTEGLLGGAYVSVEPGGSADMLSPGGEFNNTQGAVDLFGLIGQVLKPSSQGATPSAGIPNP